MISHFMCINPPTLYSSMGSISVPVHRQIQYLPYKCLPAHLHWPVSEAWFLADVATALTSPLGHLRLAEVHSLQTHWDHENGCLHSGCCILTKCFDNRYFDWDGHCGAPTLLIYCAWGDCYGAFLPHVFTWVLWYALDYTTGLLKGAGVNAEPVHKGSSFHANTQSPGLSSPRVDCTFRTDSRQSFCG